MEHTPNRAYNMASNPDIKQVSDKIATTYELQVPREIVTSVLAGRPKLPVLLSRASFRPDVNVRTKNEERRTQAQRERRNFLRGVFGFVLLSASALVLLKIATVSNTEPQTPTNAPSNPPNPSNPPPAQTGRVIANAASIPVGQSTTYNDPNLGPIILIHLNTGQFVAYSAICTHAGCQVQFDPYGNEIVCPCHGATYNPYNNAQVTGGPAPYPLPKVPIQYNSSTGNIYLTG